MYKKSYTWQYHHRTFPGWNLMAVVDIDFHTLSTRGIIRLPSWFPLNIEDSINSERITIQLFNLFFFYFQFWSLQQDKIHSYLTFHRKAWRYLNVKYINHFQTSMHCNQYICRIPSASLMKLMAFKKKKWQDFWINDNSSDSWNTGTRNTVSHANKFILHL